MSPSITRVEGPPGSGKSRLLTREAVRLQVQDGIPPGDLLILAVSRANQARLKKYLKTEALLAGLESSLPIQVYVLDDWLLALLNQGLSAHEQWGLLSDLQTRMILSGLLHRCLAADDPLWHLAGQSSLSRLIADFIRQCELQNMSPEMISSKNSGNERLVLLSKVYEAFQTQCEEARLLTYPALIQRVLKLGAIHADKLPKVILIDEAQELSESHFQFLKSLPVALVLAGNEKLGIRSHRGGQPELFQTFFQNQPVATQVQQACMRGNPAILTLLNGLLPQSIWEAQAPELEQLVSMVRFGYHDDPEKEAMMLAVEIKRFVTQVRLEDREARYTDCVILLRSAHYKKHLWQAFELNEIPFHDEGLSADTLAVQRGLFDLFHILSGWESLGLTARHFETPEALWNPSPALKNSEKEALYEINNRHLIRWLEAVLMRDEQGAALRYLRTAEAEALLWGLPHWLNAESSPPAIVEALERLKAIYAGWLDNQDPVSLFRQGVETLVPQSLPDETEGEVNLSQELALFQTSLTQLAERYQKATGLPIGLKAILAEYTALWDEVSLSLPQASGVRIRSIHQIQGEEFPWVAIPFLVSEEFPYRRDLPELLTSEVQGLLGEAFQLRFDEAEEARLLAVGMSRSTHRLILSCHKSEDGTSGLKTVLPSSFFMSLYTERQRLLGLSDSEGLKPLWAMTQTTVKTLIGMGKPVEQPTGQFQGKSVWAELPPQEQEPVFSPDFELVTSPTAMGTYMRCPRQYYYKHLLKLPEGGTAAASLGTLVHKVMEVFNSQTQPGGFTKERLRDLAEALFTFESDPNRFVMAGYGEREKRELSQMTPLSLSSLRIRLLASIEDLSDKGYFDRYASLKAVQAEKEIRDVAIDGIDRCRFKGKIDAVIQLADGNWEVVDYKTYGNSKYAAKWDLCEQNFRKILEPLPEEEGLSHRERFAGKMNSTYPIDYQLPLYYLACRQDAAYQGKLEGISLQLVRPQFPENAQQGAIRLEISARELDAHKDRMTQDIQDYIVNPILGSSHFPAMPGPNACDYCAYAGICEGAQAADEPGGEA